MKPVAIVWREPIAVQVNPQMEQIAGSHLAAEALIRRGISDPTATKVFLNPDSYQPAAPSDLPDLDLAVELLQQMVASGQRIAIWGDFDVDGQTSTTLLVSALRQLGSDITYHIPVRAQESHGVNLPGVQDLIEAGARLILTCDTGITSHDVAEYCRSQGIKYIITDHHTLPPTLPKADAVINPQRLPPGHVLSPLCGVGTAYKLIEALYQKAGRAHELNQFLDLVALGTVVDVALLKADNRYLVQRGLDVLRTGQRPALQIMLNLAEINTGNLTEDHLGFVLGPRLNALGRLGDANPAVGFLSGSPDTDLEDFARTLEELNFRRKQLCDWVFKSAQSMLERDRSLLDAPVLVLAHPEWQAGVVGIVASRLVDLYARPVILLSAPAGEIAHGSARSVEGINITTAIAAHQEMLVGFGGHPMAAGLGIESERIPAFRQALARTIEKMSSGATHIKEIAIDAFLPLEALTLDLVADLDRLAPFGAGNPAPVLATRGLNLQSANPIGKTGEHLRLLVENSAGTVQEVFWWQGAGSDLPEGTFDLAFCARASNFKGQTRIQLDWLHARPVEIESISISSAGSTVKILDQRNDANPLATLEAFNKQFAQLPIWAEGVFTAPSNSQTRLTLKPGVILAIWSVPPGLTELTHVLQTVRPSTLILFSAASPSDSPQDVMNQLAGLTRHILKTRDGLTSLEELAGLMGQRKTTVSIGLHWLSARGYITIQPGEDDQIKLSTGSGISNLNGVRQAEIGLNSMLEETRAFRIFYQQSDLSLMVQNALTLPPQTKKEIPNE